MSLLLFLIQDESSDDALITLISGSVEVLARVPYFLSGVLFYDKFFC